MTRSRCLVAILSWYECGNSQYPILAFRLQTAGTPGLRGRSTRKESSTVKRTGAQLETKRVKLSLTSGPTAIGEAHRYITVLCINSARQRNTPRLAHVNLCSRPPVRQVRGSTRQTMRCPCRAAVNTCPGTQYTSSTLERNTDIMRCFRPRCPSHWLRLHASMPQSSL